MLKRKTGDKTVKQNRKRRCHDEDGEGEQEGTRVIDEEIVSKGEGDEEAIQGAEKL